MKLKIYPIIIALPGLYFPISTLSEALHSCFPETGCRAPADYLGIIIMELAVPVIIYLYAWFVYTKFESKVAKTVGFIIADLLFIGMIIIAVFTYLVSLW